MLSGYPHVINMVFLCPYTHEHGLFSLSDSMEMWRSGTRFSGGLGSVRLVVGLYDLTGLFNRSDSMIL